MRGNHASSVSGSFSFEENLIFFGGKETVDLITDLSRNCNRALKRFSAEEFVIEINKKSHSRFPEKPQPKAAQPKALASSASRFNDFARAFHHNQSRGDNEIYHNSNSNLDVMPIWRVNQRFNMRACKQFAIVKHAKINM